MIPCWSSSLSLAVLSIAIPTEITFKCQNPKRRSYSLYNHSSKLSSSIYLPPSRMYLIPQRYIECYFYYPSSFGVFYPIFPLMVDYTWLSDGFLFPHTATVRCWARRIHGSCEYNMTAFICARRRNVPSILQTTEILPMMEGVISPETRRSLNATRFRTLSRCEEIVMIHSSIFIIRDYREVPYYQNRWVSPLWVIIMRTCYHFRYLLDTASHLDAIFHYTIDDTVS